MIAMTACRPSPVDDAPAAPSLPVDSLPVSPSTEGTPAGPATTPGPYTSALRAGVVDNAAFDAIELELTRRVSSAGLPGASLLVVQHGVLVEQEAWLDYTLDTHVPIASGSKWLTAATVMTVVDEGLLTLDEPIASYLPKIENTPVGAITLRQLLSFTSGLVDSDPLPEASDPKLSLVDTAAVVLRHGLIHVPGSTFRYGGQHLIVAAALAEVVTGRPFVQLFHERIAGPLAMAHTTYLQVGDNRSTDVHHPGPAGSAVSTLSDYARFLEMLVHDGLAPSGHRVLSSRAVAAMQTNQTEGLRYGPAAPFRQAERAPYGFGEWLDWTSTDGSALVLSSDGKFGFRPWIDRRNDLFGVYLVDDREQATSPGGDTSGSSTVAVSGNWIFAMVANAVGGDLPIEKYPHRDR